MITQYYDPYDFLLFANFWLVFPLIWLGIGLLISIWVYTDAKKHTKTRGNEILWLLLVIFLGIIGLLIYLFARGGLISEQEYSTEPRS